MRGLFLPSISADYRDLTALEAVFLRPECMAIALLVLNDAVFV